MRRYTPPEMPTQARIRDHVNRVSAENARLHGKPIEQRPGTLWEAWHSNTAHPLCPPGQREVWVSRQYLVQVFEVESYWKRLTICRVDQREIRESWDALQRIKNEVVGPESWAVESYPADTDLMNVAPMRHLWIVPADVTLPCQWRRGTMSDQAAARLGMKPIGRPRP